MVLGRVYYSVAGMDGGTWLAFQVPGGVWCWLSSPWRGVSCLYDATAELSDAQCIRPRVPYQERHAPYEEIINYDQHKL